LHAPPALHVDGAKRRLPRPSSAEVVLHHVRVIGNFAAHPEKSTSTGEIVDVEPGEAEWTLDVLDSLFDFYFVRPAKLAQRKVALDKKLADTGKRPLKGRAAK
jgi:hypothetical protein